MGEYRDAPSSPAHLLPGYGKTRRTNDASRKEPIRATLDETPDCACRNSRAEWDQLQQISSVWGSLLGALFRGYIPGVAILRMTVVAL